MQRCKPKVCFPLGGREGGGMGNSTLQLMQGICRERFSILVVACEDGPYTARIRSARHPCDILGTGWPPMMRRYSAAGTGPSWSGYAAMPAWVMRTTCALSRYVRVHRIDIVHTNYHHFHFVAALACALTGRKCVWHWRAPILHLARGSQHGHKPSRHRPRRDRRWAFLGKTSWMVRTSTAGFVWSVANSRITAESVSGLTGDRLSVVYNGIPIAPPPRDRPRLRDILGLPERTRIVGLVGSLNPVKGHVQFLEAAARVCRKYDDVHFVYIGGPTAAGQHGYLDALLAKRAHMRLQGRVHFLGHRADAAWLIADFDMATVCTLPPGEGFGLVLVEAMAQAVAVIATREGAAPEIVADGMTGVLIPAGDPDALASAIESLLDDPGRRRALGRAGLEVCREKFDIDRTLLQMEAVYKKVMAL